MKEDPLFSLVQSMTRNEKRHFRIRAGQMKSSSNYMIVYDEMESSDRFDEGAFKQKFKGQKFVKQLHVTKNYLKEQLLRSLREYHHDISKKAIIQDTLRNVELLFEREQLQMCKKELEKAERLAKSFKYDTVLLVIHQWKRKIIQGIESINNEAIIEVVKAEGEVLKRVNNTYDLKLQHVLLYDKVLPNSTSPHNLNITPPQRHKALTAEAKIYEAHSNYIKLIREQKFTKAIELMEALIKQVKQNKGLFEEEPGLYFSTVNNYLGLLVYLKEWKKALTAIDSARNIYSSLNTNRKSRAIFRQLARTTNLELEIYRDTDGKAIETGKLYEIEQFIQKNESKIQDSYLHLFWYQFAAIKFKDEDYKGSLLYLNRLISLPVNSLRNDLLIYSRMLNLMLHYELNNMFVLGYYIDHTKRILKKHKLFTGWKREIMKYFTELRRCPTYEARNIFQKMHVKLFKISQSNDIGEIDLDYLNLKNWIEKHT